MRFRTEVLPATEGPASSTLSFLFVQVLQQDADFIITLFDKHVETLDFLLLLGIYSSILGASHIIVL